MAFDPDAYIASFDPDAYLASKDKPAPKMNQPREFSDAELGIESQPIRGRTDMSIVTDPEAMRLQAENAGNRDFGVTSQHGETGDPMARDINATILMNPMMRLLGAGLKAGSNKLLSTEAGKLGEVAAKGTRAPSPEALEAATAEAGSMSRSAMADMLELQAQAREAEAVKAAQEATRFSMPSVSPMHPFKAAADIARASGLPIGARAAPLARKVVETEAPLASPAQSLLMQFLMRGDR